MKHWIEAARLRTLPLALSGVVMASLLANSTGSFSRPVLFLVILTTVLLQILSNFANDYGDTENGADSVDRVGPTRSVQSGKISMAQMKKAIIFLILLSLMSGISLLYISFGGFRPNFFVFLGIGLLAILAAYTYTAGTSPYGYMGLGDLSVFLFFGLVAVLGTLFLYTSQFELINFLPALSIGFIAVGVLNINNIRDIASDTKAGKITIPVRLGPKNARIYHACLLLLACFSMLIFAYLKPFHHLYFLAGIALLLVNIFQVSKVDNPDAYLKTLALSSLAFSLLSGLSL